MSDKVDDLILQMQHLEASAKEQGKARGAQIPADRLKSRAHQMAASAQAELQAAQSALAEGEEKLQRARTPGLPPLEAADLQLEGRRLVELNKPAVVKARARYNFALDAMDEADRRGWEALQAEARAEAHAQLAAELEPGGALSTAAPAAPAGDSKPKGT
jgi:hypothetical protein